MKNRLFVLLTVFVLAIVFSACESEAPLESQSPRVDTVLIYDSTFVFVIDTVVFYDTVLNFDSVFIIDTLVIIDSVLVPGGQDSLVYQDCRILKCNTKVATLGEPGYFVTVSRKETNGHAIKFCLYVYRRGAEYVGILSATHLKSEWPVVKVKVEATNYDDFDWYLDKKHQTLEFTF